MTAIIELTHPVQQQVIQRNKRNEALVRIEGSLAVAFDSIEVRTTLEDACVGSPLDWHAVKVSRCKGKFETAVTLPAGGWYALEVRAKAKGQVVAEGTVARVGIGEVFVVTGQSNAANCGGDKLTPGDERVVAYNEGAWQKADDPQPGSQGEGGSWVPPLGTLLAQSLQVPIGFVATALGGSALAWRFPHPRRPKTPKFAGTPDSIFGRPVEDFHLYDNLLRRARAQGKQGIRAVLWHQGESEGAFKTPPAEHCEGMRFLIGQLNKELGYKLPWVVARASYLPMTTAKQQRDVVEGQRLIWKNGVALQGPSTDDLLAAKFRYDTVHFSGYGLQVHASRWFAALWAHFFADQPMVTPGAKQTR